MSSKYLYIQFIVGIVFGCIIACSPTKFSPTQNVNSFCDASVTQCVVQSGSLALAQNYKIGSGKVDILFVNDNSASMSIIQKELASKFSGFIQYLDSKSIDYRIAITTSDLKSVTANKLITYDNGSKYITNADSDRVLLFHKAIIRNETIACEELITSMYDSFGTSFQSNSYYASQYPIRCPSPDTRGIYTANMIVSENSNSFMRSDANLNIILISNDNVRQGNAMENNDTSSAFISMMQSKYQNKYWDFNSIIVKDATCRSLQTLRNANGQIIYGQSGQAISGGIGLEYANLSNSAARDIENNPRPRGQILNICESDYAPHFDKMSTQIAEDSRMFTMKCTPTQAPVIKAVNDSSLSITHTWSGDKIIFKRGNEGTTVSISYKCYTGPT